MTLRNFRIHFIDVILPIPVARAFTYSITEAEAGFIKIGARVAVPFGKKKIYTGLVYRIHESEPKAYEAKEIYQILDEEALITEKQLQLWEWISSYYLCTLGEVMRAALPNGFLLESETWILRHPGFDDHYPDELNTNEQVVWETMSHRQKVKVEELEDILEKKNVLGVIKRMLDRDMLKIREEVAEKYRPRWVKYVHLHDRYSSEENMHQLLDDLQRAPKQKATVMTYFSLQAGKDDPLALKELKQHPETTESSLRSLIDKGVFTVEERQEDRVSFDQGEEMQLSVLNDEQRMVLNGIGEHFLNQRVCLLHGVTSSGKTEIYMHLIAETLQQGRQVLYLLPEIALTTHIIGRLKRFFGSSISVFHSRYSGHERIEVWNNLLSGEKKADIILGARSSVLLPFENLGLIIVDEEHDGSYKQYDPAPRYQARDTAIVLGSIHGAHVLLGSATPSIESYHNAREGKYGLVQLHNRYQNIRLPEVELVDIAEKYRKKRMNGHFSDRLLKLIQEALSERSQVILFQNRRGFAPIVECKTCGNAPQCPNCDVSLTYHKFKSELRCHYCGHSRPLPELCPACNSPALDTKGFGTEQIENELSELFPDSKVARMDLDTTRGKYSYEKILKDFQSGEIDILVGTQMLTKGLDFKGVSLVGVLNADNLLNFPDFRAHERTFQLMVQVSGRAGRSGKRGKVAIQTFNPYHTILQRVSVNDYPGMFAEQLQERYEFEYPPYVRLIRITLKDRDFSKVDQAAIWMGKSLRMIFGEQVLGPSTPSVGRIRNKYLRTVLLKIPGKSSIQGSKKQVMKVSNTFGSIPQFRSVQLILDVDPQ